MKMEKNINSNIEELLQKNAILEKEITELKIKLEISNAKQRKYYETHRQAQIQRVKEYQEKTNYIQKIPQEKKREYARKAYLKKKEKDRIRKEQEEKERTESSEKTSR